MTDTVAYVYMYQYVWSTDPLWWNEETGWSSKFKDATHYDFNAMIAGPLPHPPDNDLLGLSITLTTHREDV